MDRYLIVADDFTGANDTGVQLKKFGIDTSVVFSDKFIEEDISSYVIDTESRGIAEEDSYRKVINAVNNINISTFKYVFKKVDSTLRGNIAAEIKAIDDIYKWDLIIFAPAFPDLKRTTVNGIHMLNSIPITKTEMSKDPIKPVKEDNINSIIKNNFDEEVVHIYLNEIRKNSINLSRGRIYTFDAETNDDLVKIVKESIKSNKKVLWVGSAGLANNLLKVNIPVKPAIAVVGSVSDISKRQVYNAIKSGSTLIKIDIENIIKNKDVSNIENEIIDKVNKGLDVIITTAYDKEDYNKAIYMGNSLGYSRVEVSIFTQKTLGKIIGNVLERCEVSGLFLTGGDTAIAIIEELDAYGASIKQEIMKGIPLIRLKGGKYNGLKIITKAGAFGEDNAIEYSFQKLKEEF